MTHASSADACACDDYGPPVDSHTIETNPGCIGQRRPVLRETKHEPDAGGSIADMSRFKKLGSADQSRSIRRSLLRSSWSAMFCLTLLTALVGGVGWTGSAATASPTSTAGQGSGNRSAALATAPGCDAVKGLGCHEGRLASGTKQDIGTVIAHLSVPGTVAKDAFGTSGVAVSGDSVLVGAPGYNAHAGRAYVFTRELHGWKIDDLTGIDTAAGDNFGASVAISGATAVVAAPYHDAQSHFPGRVYVFHKTSDGWAQVAELHGAFRASFGKSVAFSDGTIVVGSYQNWGVNCIIDVFTQSPSGWKAQPELMGPLDGPEGNVTAPLEVSVAISGATIVAGVWAESDHSGAFVFTRTPHGWMRTGILRPAGRSPYGYTVAVSGGHIILCPLPHFPLAKHLFGPLVTLVYSQMPHSRTSGAWREVASSQLNVDGVGSSVAFSGTTIVEVADGRLGALGTFIYTVTSNHLRLLSRTGLGSGLVPAVSGTTVVVGGRESVYLLHV